MENQQPRLKSIDALRGFDMLFIMGFSGFIIALCSLFPNGSEWWLAQTMKHVRWHGLAHHDTIFPLFLFLAGLSFPFSYAKSVESGLSRGRIYMKIVRRAATLFLLGLIYNGLLKFDFENLRICSVLGRIGVAWAVAAVMYINFGRISRISICGALLVGYYLVVCYIPAPDVEGAEALTMQGSIVGYVDRLLTPGVLHKGVFDPEGLLSTIPAAVTALLGVFTGEFVRDAKYSGGRKTLTMLGVAALMLCVGLLWSIEFPINKSLWSSSFVLVVGAYSLALFAIFYYIIDVRGCQGWAIPFCVIGMNSITIYMAQKLLSFQHTNKLLLGGFASLFSEEWGNLILKGGYVIICWLFLYFLYRKRIFLKV